MRDYRIYTYKWKRRYRPIFRDDYEGEAHVATHYVWSEDHTSRVVAPSRGVADAWFQDSYSEHPAYKSPPRKDDPDGPTGRGEYVELISVTEDAIEAFVTVQRY